MKPEIIIPFVMIDIFATIMILSFVVARNRSGKEAGKMAEIAIGIKGRLKKSLFMSPVIEVSDQGSPMVISYFCGGSKSGPPHLDVSLVKKPPFRLLLTKEGAVPQIFKKAGLIREMVINVPDFDNKFLIQTSDKMKCLMYLSDYRKREIIESLYAGGWQVIFETDRLKLKSTFITELAPAGVKALPKSITVPGLREVFAEGLKAANFLPILDTLTAEYMSGILEKLYRLSEGWAERADSPPSE
ncbi:MAG: hypothetical protein NTY10_00330 [Candidatus Omnitrophica bacterium]|nr:hypothetical protein [Candidatus Omnitrophota bacterium]